MLHVLVCYSKEITIELNITGRLPSAGNLKLNCASRAHSFHVKTNTAKQTFIRYTIYFYVLKTHLKEDKLFFFILSSS